MNRTPDASHPLLILDLDETLLHASETPVGREADFRVGPFHVYERPSVRDFLSDVAILFRVAVWTSATSGFAVPALRAIAPPAVRFEFVWTRDRCTRRIDQETRKVLWVKDLKKVKGRGERLEQVLMVDDTPAKLQRQYGNLIRIQPYLGSEVDGELLALLSYLREICPEPNYRRIEKRGWRSRF
ncbi:MAG: HAD family hydrolase [Bacteroidota bacterium]